MLLLLLLLYIPYLFVSYGLIGLTLFSLNLVLVYMYNALNSCKNVCCPYGIYFFAVLIWYYLELKIFE